MPSVKISFDVYDACQDLDKLIQSVKDLTSGCQQAAEIVAQLQNRLANKMVSGVGYVLVRMYGYSENKLWDNYNSSFGQIRALAA